MVPYFILVALPALVWVTSKEYRFQIGKKLIYKTRTGCINVFMIIFFLLLALRSTECGIDTRQYLRLFQKYSNMSLSRIVLTQKHELGYKLLNRLIGFLRGDYQLFLAVVSAICVFPLWHFYKRESENPLLTIALFLTVAPFVMYFSGMRQAIAMSIGVIAWYYAREKSPFRFILVVILALQFHRSAMILFTIYPLYHVKITPRWLWAVVPCMVLVFIFKTHIFNFLFTFLWKEYELTSETGATNVLILLILFAVYSYIIPDERKMDEETTAMRNLLLCSVVLQFFAMLHPLSMRMNYYFLIYVPILIPRIAARSKEQYKQIAGLSVVVMTVFFMYYFISNGIKDNDDLNVFPYIPFWK